MHNKAWISALCSFLLSLSLQHTAYAYQHWDSNPWLPFYSPPQHIKIPDDLEDRKGVFDDAPNSLLRISDREGLDSTQNFSPWEDDNDDDERQGSIHMGPASDVRAFLNGAPSRDKRVFLSRGWMAGGYKAPAPPAPNRFVRRPPALAPAPLRHTKPYQADGTNDGQAHYAAALVADQPKQSPPFRKFHSIFTSGMWTPLGKRSQAGSIPHGQYYY